jgi:hypothetical protein
VSSLDTEFIGLSVYTVELYPRTLDSTLFVASHDSQGYGGGILTDLHTGYLKNSKFKFK